ncbi:hypothetical protein [Roseovarius sp. M141]|uniref:hypothetical protein n=1 Tax=Roseovarius sp. M141 TaxID=2583806 RepID=UPI0020CDE977|nr:hypothetical protein [Roseovarius sp. M141]
MSGKYAAIFLAGLFGLTGYFSAPSLTQAEVDALYASPNIVAAGPQAVFHIGHSLVGRDMPAMLAQLAGPGHHYDSQLGWGATLKAHWDPDTPIAGFEQENDHPRYRDAHEAVDSGAYDALVLTEMVEIRDAIKYFDSATYLQKWADAGWAANPDLRIYLYESWHSLKTPEGWLERLDKDLSRYWDQKILRPALAELDESRPIYVIPAGQVMAHFVRAVEAQDGVAEIADRSALFSDEVHVNDLGAYLVALTHYAVLYQKSPVGLPYALLRADGSPATSPSPEIAQLMQETVWDVVSSDPKAGLP